MFRTRFSCVLPLMAFSFLFLATVMVFVSLVIPISHANTLSSKASTFVANSQSCWDISATPPVTYSTDSTLYGVVALGADNVWAAAGEDSNFFHWDGTNWSTKDGEFPRDRHIDGQFRAMAGIAANDIWAVGSYPQEGGDDKSVVNHWNGISWRLVTPTDGYAYLGLSLGVPDLPSVEA